MSVNVFPARALPEELCAAWRELRAADPSLDSPFFAPQFIRAVAEVRNDVEIAVIERGGEPVGFFPFQRREDDIGQPVGGAMSGLHGLVLRNDQTIDAYQLLRACGLSAWHFRELAASQPAFRPYHWYQEKSPCIDTSQGFEAYCQQRRAAGSHTVHKTFQKMRKLERELGPVRFEVDIQSNAVLSALVDWKSQQLQSAGEFDLFTVAWTRRLLARLLEHDSDDFRGTLSALYVGGTPQAAYYSLRSNRVQHVWIAAYNPQLARYSPGYQLLLRMIQEAHGRGIDRIDLGRGAERFKASFATGAIPLAAGSVDSRPGVRTMRWAWHYSRYWISRSPLRKSAAVPWRLIRRIHNPTRNW